MHIHENFAIRFLFDEKKTSSKVFNSKSFLMTFCITLTMKLAPNVNLIFISLILTIILATIKRMISHVYKRMLRLNDNYILCIINDVQAEDTLFVIY